MDNIWLTCIAMLLATSATVLQLSEAACGGSRPTCNTDDDCDPGLVCLPTGQSGVKKCWNCECSDTSQCEIIQGKLTCNCSQTAGYYGTHCDCPPVSDESCADAFSVYGECNTFSDDAFEVLNSRILNAGETVEPVFTYFYTNSSGESDCKAKCIENDCHVFTYGQGSCDVFGKTDTMPLSTILDSISEEDTFDIHIRKCIEC
ncbi:uncharacterized protein LOC132748594 [Ruditapes philippinarum]|uniref:uncharacterized protein LOC132748594 n=1 Tax=Ruditapes philippinarum TaxID=129788 RepID=UPI00295B7436|nr:uncharacterized protein LOC132748594 [Ruditapes philippinarum]